MARNIDVAYKFGCERYIQGENAIADNLYNELKNLGKKVLFVAGYNGYKFSEDKIKKAIDNTDVEYEVRMFNSVPCFENAEEIAKQVTLILPMKPHLKNLKMP